MPLFVALVSLLSLIFGEQEAEIVFAGDAMMHTRQIETAHRQGQTYDFSEYFSDIAPYIRNADYAVVNLETPVSAAPFSGYPQFNAPGAYIDALAHAGFDLFLTANNHTLDRRDKGLCNTIDSLDRRGLDHIGTYKTYAERFASTPLIKELNGIKVAFLNYTYGTNGITPGNVVQVDYIDRELMRRDVLAARKAGAEFIFACLHWGVEYEKLPHSSQKSTANYLFGLGVDAIIGSHPHVIQPIEYSDGKLLVYSLGNFISDMRTTDTRGGAMVKVKLRRLADGTIEIADASYRLVFTEPADNQHNFRLKWVDSSSDSRAKAFSQAARAVYDKHNVGVNEDR